MSNHRVEEPKGPEDKARDLAVAFFTVFNILHWLAAPRLLARVLAEPKRPTQQNFLEAFDDFPIPSGEDQKLGQPMRRMRELIVVWDFRAPAPKEIVKTARAILATMGTVGSDEKWDQWDPVEEDDAPPPRRETPKILRPEPMTLEEWGNVDEPGELVDGMLIEEEETTPEHDAIVKWLLNTLRAWAEPRGASVFGPGHKLAVSATTGRKPDICVYEAGSSPEGGSRFSQTPPSVLIEVLSPRSIDLSRARIEKVREYARLGVRWYWMVDPNEHLIEFLQRSPDGEYPRFMAATEGKVCEIGLEGLELDLDHLFASCPPNASAAV
jgi:Uma2 family endonuclease